MSKILIIDFGSQYTQLIAKKLRSLKIYCEVTSHNISNITIAKYNPQAIILSGSGDSVNNKNENKIPSVIRYFNIPTIGICYGQHILIKEYGGIVKKTSHQSYGLTTVKIKYKDKKIDN